MEESTGSLNRHQELTAHLRELAEGRLEGQDQMPTELELARSYGVSRQTVRRAYQELVAEGVVRRYRGKGTFAVRSPSNSTYFRSFGSVDDFIALSLDTEMRIISPLSTEWSPHVASLLDIKGDQTIVSVEFIRMHQGHAICLTSVSVPPRLGEAIASSFAPDNDETIVSRIDQVHPGGVATVEQEITAIACPMHVSAQLECPQGQPMLLITRLYRDDNGVPVELARTHYDPNYFTYRIHLGRG
jgi:GntR family transcriptional regulator